MNEHAKRLLLWAAIIVFLFLALNYLFVYLTPFVLGGVLAILISPLVNRLERLMGGKRGLAVLIILLLFIAIIFILVILGISQTYLELNRLLKNLPDYQEISNRIRLLLQENDLIKNFSGSESTETLLNNTLQVLYNEVRKLLISISNYIFKFLSSLPHIITILILGFIAAFFISKDQESIYHFIVDLFPDIWQNKVKIILERIVESVVGFIRSMLILISFTGLIIGGGLFLLGNNYALLIGLASAILDLIPIIGPGLIFYPWIVYAFIVNNITQGISLAVLFMVYTVIRSALQGKVMGENLGLHPLSILISLYIGFRLLGARGFVIGPIFMILLKSIYTITTGE